MSSLKLPSINQVALSGRLTQDPEFRFTESGTAKLSFNIASNRSYKNKNEEWQEEVTFVPVTVWGKSAEYFAEKLFKGSAIFVTGKLESYSYESSNGNRTILRINARAVQILEKQEVEEKKEPQEISG